MRRDLHSLVKLLGAELSQTSCALSGTHTIPRLNNLQMMQRAKVSLHDNTAANMHPNFLFSIQEVQLDCGWVVAKCMSHIAYTHAATSMHLGIHAFRR